MQAPFPYFGGKAPVAPAIWERFGAVRNYVEPFCGSLAVLLNRPAPWEGSETVNDADGMIANFWRAVAAVPEEVARHADWPVNECLPAGTVIATPDGEVPIKSIRPGMTVWGERDGRLVPTVVVATKQSEAADFRRIGALMLTGNHPVWTSEKGYVEADALAGDETIGVIGNGGSGNRSQQGGHPVCLARQSPLQRVHLPRPVTVFNFQTTTGNYFAQGVLVHNCDLHARHAWLVGQKESLQARLEGEPEYFDPKIAGWWVWGCCCWIGSGWCSGDGPWNVVDGKLVNTGADGGNRRKLVHLGDAGQGVNRQLVHLGDAGRGVNRQLVHLGDAGLYLWLGELSARLRRVRVCCGDWSRVCGPTPTTKQGLTAVFLDPPYGDDDGRQADLYRVDSGTVAADARAWAIEHGGDPLLRIALCGYDGFGMPGDWTPLRWKARGGYGSQGGGIGRANAAREVVWFSRHCVTEGGPLFAAAPQPALFPDDAEAP